MSSFKMPDPERWVARCAIATGPSGEGQCRRPAEYTAQTFRLDTFHLVIGVCGAHASFHGADGAVFPAGWEIGLTDGQ